MEKGQLHMGRKSHKYIPVKFYKILSVTRHVFAKLGSAQSLFLQLQH